MKIKIEKLRKECHRFQLNVDIEIWEKFVSFLPLSVTPTEKIKRFISDFIREQERITSDKEIKKMQQEIDDAMKKIK